MVLVQGAFGKNALVTFGLSTYVMLGLRVVCSTVEIYPPLISALEPASLLLLHFPTFQLGGPLALPWGLYVLICQVHKIS